MLLFNVTLIGNISFQLSALAALGMILFSKSAPTPATEGKKFVAWVKEELATTLSAQVFTIPLILFTFGRISLISPITNLLIGWTIPIITVLGLCISLFGWIWLPLGQLLAWVTWVFLEWLIQAVIITSRIPLASIGK
jgi:competence protein ComEC